MLETAEAEAKEARGSLVDNEATARKTFERILSMTPRDTISPSLRSFRSYVLWSGNILYFFVPVWSLIALETTSPELLQHRVTHVHLATLVLMSLLAALSGKRFLDYGLDGEPPLPVWLLPTLGTLATISMISGALIDTSFQEAAPLAATPAVLPVVALGVALQFMVSIRTNYLTAVLPPAIGGIHQAIQGYAVAEYSWDVIATRVLVTVIVVSILSFTLAASYHWTMSVLRGVDAQSKFDAMKAELSAAEERLRIARDLHDVFGRTLTAVAVKSELAAALADAEGANNAAAESRRIKELAQEALKEVRNVLAEYRRPDLSTELAGAHSLLNASGISVRIMGSVADSIDSLPDADAQRTSEALALVVREAGTNIVRHSNGAHVSFLLSHDQDTTELIIMNDGVERSLAPREYEETPGSGLESVALRLLPLGGKLQWGVDGATFTVHAWVNRNAHFEEDQTLTSQEDA